MYLGIKTLLFITNIIFNHNKKIELNYGKIQWMNFFFSLRLEDFEVYESSENFYKLLIDVIETKNDRQIG